MINLKKIRKQVNKLLARKHAAEILYKHERKNLKVFNKDAKYIKEALGAAQLIAKEVQTLAHKRLSKVVTRCLETVFDGDDVYGFKIRFDRKRNKTEAILILTKNGHEIEDPLNADSGGVVDIAAFALRTACIILAKPHLRRFLALDEPFKFVSEEFRYNVRMLLEGLSKDFDFQYLLVTHERAYHIGKVIRL